LYGADLHPVLVWSLVMTTSNSITFSFSFKLLRFYDDDKLFLFFNRMLVLHALFRLNHFWKWNARLQELCEVRLSFKRHMQDFLTSLFCSISQYFIIGCITQLSCGMNLLQGKDNMEYFIGLIPSGVAILRNKTSVANYSW
jgi:hypothetical protein